MSAADATVNCPACAKRIKFKPELAGKKLRCACGQVFRMPSRAGGDAQAMGHVPANPGNDAAAQAAEMARKNLTVTPGEGGAYDLSDTSVSILPKEEPGKKSGGNSGGNSGGKCPQCGKAVKVQAVICVNCGFNLQAGTQVASEVISSKKKKSGPSSVLEAYASTARARGISQEQEEAQAARQARITEFYVPLGLAVAGVAALFVTPAIFVPAGTAFQLWYTLLRVGVELILRMPFLVLAIFLTARIMQTSFGPFLTALLKLMGLAFFTAGIGGLIDHVVNHFTEGLGSFFITPLIHLGIFWGLTVYLFSLDFMESMVLYLLASFLPWIVLGFLLIWVMTIFS